MAGHLTGHTLDVTSLLSVGQHLVSASGDKTVRVWRSQSAAALHTLTGHSDMVVDLASCHDGRLPHATAPLPLAPQDKEWAKVNEAENPPATRTADNPPATRAADDPPASAAGPSFSSLFRFL